MSTKLFIGNLSWNIGNDQLREAFASFGELEDVFVMMDRDTGRSRGFAFVTFKNQEDAEAAIQGMNGKELDGRQISVDVARPKKEGGGRPSFQR